MAEKNWDEYINTQVQCECGQNHLCEIKHIIIEEDAVSKLPELIMSGLYHNICVVLDSTTEEIIGRSVYQVLRNNLIPYQSVVLNDKKLLPNERSVGKIMVGIPAKCDLIVAVGSGTISDLCKYISYKLGIDCIIVATAPSMDGYASGVASIIIDNIKNTFEVSRPTAIIADTNILTEAPYEMITAGVGDILSRYACLADWKMASVITREHYCASISEIMKASVNNVVKVLNGIKNRDREAVKVLMEELVLSGIVMNYVGNSRPASGSEHHLAHYWEMMFAQRNTASPYHGHKAALGTAVVLKLYEYIKEHRIDFEKIPPAEFKESEWEDNIIKAYGDASDEVIKLEKAIHKNSDDEVEKRRIELRQNIDQIMEIIDNMPCTSYVINILKSIDAPYSLDVAGIDEEMLRQSIMYAKEFRNRYGILQMLFDIGELEAAANEIKL